MKQKVLSLLLTLVLVLGCLPMAAGAAKTELSENECQKIAEQYWGRTSDNEIYSNYSAPKVFDGKKYYYYTLQKFMGTHSTTIDYLFVEITTGDCYFGVGKPEHQVFKNYEEVLKKLIKEKGNSSYSDIWNRGLFLDIDGDSHNELLILKEKEGEQGVLMLMGTVFTEKPNGKVIPLIKELHLQNDVAAPKTAIRVLKKDDKKYISLFGRNSASEGDQRWENGSHRLYELYGGFDSSAPEDYLPLSSHDEPSVIKYEEVTKYDSNHTIDMNESSATIDGKRVTYQEYLSFLESFHVVDYISTPYSENITPTPKGYTFEELLEQYHADAEGDSSDEPFRDIPTNAYYYKAACWAKENGVMVGDGMGHLTPEKGCTRAEVVQVLKNLSGDGTGSGDSSFTDVPNDAWYSAAVEWAVANGITSGTGNNKFSPNATCTRGQIVTFLYKYAG